MSEKYANLHIFLNMAKPTEVGRESNIAVPLEVSAEELVTTY